MRHLRRHFANYVNNFWPLRYLLRKRVRLWPRRPWASSTLTCGLCRQHMALRRLSTSTTAQRSAAQRSTACAPHRDLRAPTRSTPSALGPFGPVGLRPFGPVGLFFFTSACGLCREHGLEKAQHVYVFIVYYDIFLVVLVCVYSMIIFIVLAPMYPYR